MRVHRFFVEPNTIELKHDFWLHDQRLINQWRKVLRFQPGQNLVLFDGQTSERLYKLNTLTETEAHLVLVTDYDRRLPTAEVFLFWSLLKKDKNDWILQKATELGASHFIPLLAARSEKTGFNIERARKIIIEASEQCGRSDIPTTRDPIDIETVFKEFAIKMPLYVCEQSSHGENLAIQLQKNQSIGVLVGPEGGWSDSEKSYFLSQKPNFLNLHDFTLRAETAAITAVSKFLKNS